MKGTWIDVLSGEKERDDLGKNEYTASSRFLLLCRTATSYQYLKPLRKTDPYCHSCLIARLKKKKNRKERKSKILALKNASLV